MAHQGEVKELLRHARGLGLRVEKTAKAHFKIIHPDGRYTLVGGSPGSAEHIRRARSNVAKLVAGKPITKQSQTWTSLAGSRAQSAG